jgi:hypothetical protein
MRWRAVEFPAKNGGEACGSTDEADACNTAACVMQARTAYSHGLFAALIASRAPAGGL